MTSTHRYTQEAMLFERAEADSLTHLERAVFRKSRILNYGEEDAISPVSAWAKYLAWLCIVTYAVGMAFYVCLFAVKAGKATSIQWMISFWVAFAEVSRAPHCVFAEYARPLNRTTLSVEGCVTSS